MYALIMLDRLANCRIEFMVAIVNNIRNNRIPNALDHLILYDQTANASKCPMKIAISTIKSIN